MFMDILPILSTLRRHKTAAALIVLEIALTCAIVCNALFLIGQRIERLKFDSGWAESELIAIRAGGVPGEGNAEAMTQQDLALLRGIAGVKSVSLVNQFMYGDSQNFSSVRLAPGEGNSAVIAAMYSFGEEGLATAGLRLIEGRDFLPGEFQPAINVETRSEPNVPAALISRDMAEKLFPGRSALGQHFYAFGDAPTRVVGVVERLTAPRLHRPNGAEGDYSMVVPLRPTYRDGVFLLRADAAAGDRVLRDAVAALEKADPRRIIALQQRLTDLRANYYAQDRAMAWLLGGVCVALLVITAFGIVGLASFWVQQRTRMIGTRRALGATRLQILRYFQAENFLLSSVGIALGMIGAYGISLVLMHAYELPRLPWHFLPAGAVVLWTLGQIAVLAPARRAAALPPVVVMRGA